MPCTEYEGFIAGDEPGVMDPMYEGDEGIMYDKGEFDDAPVLLDSPASVTLEVATPPAPESKAM